MAEKLPSLTEAKKALTDRGYTVKKEGDNYLVGLRQGGTFLATGDQIKSKAAFLLEREPLTE